MCVLKGQREKHRLHPAPQRPELTSHSHPSSLPLSPPLCLAAGPQPLSTTSHWARRPSSPDCTVFKWEFRGSRAISCSQGDHTPGVAA